MKDERKSITLNLQTSRPFRLGPFLTIALDQFLVRFFNQAPFNYFLQKIPKYISPLEDRGKVSFYFT